MAVITYTENHVFLGGYFYLVYVTGTVNTGETYTITTNSGVLTQYVALPGDTISDVITALYNGVPALDRIAVFSDRFNIRTYTDRFVSTSTTPPPPPPPTPPTPPPPGVVVVDYGLKYICTFDPPSGTAVFFKPRYTLEILQKGYTGATSNVLGSASPVIHTYQTDDTRAPIRGSSLSINLINEGQIPLSSFFSVDDDAFKVRFWWTEQVLLSHTEDHLLFEGFIVQDDCTEQMVDFNHEINLSATDNLGLLKGISFDKAPASYSLQFTSVEPFESTAPHTIKVSNAFGSTVDVNNKLSVSGTSVDGTYLITNKVIGLTQTTLTTFEPIGTQTPTTATLGVYVSNVLDKITLLSVIQRCLSATNLSLKTNIYSNLLEVNNLDTSSFLDQVLIDSQTFLKNDSDYEDCYTVLENTLARFNLSLFQAKGVWNIVRWDELRYYNNLISGFSYDEYFAFIGAVTLDAALTASPYDPVTVPDMYPLTGLQHRIFRPFVYDKETFNYKQPPQLLRNFNLQQLGVLLRTYTTGTGTSLQKINEYEVRWWYATKDPSGTGGTSEYFIRVISDSLDNEIERYLVVKTNNIKSYKIEVNKDDTFKFSFSFRTQGGGSVSSIRFFIELYDGVTRTWLVGPPGLSSLPGGGVSTGWRNLPLAGWFVDTPTGTTNWQTVEIDASTFPFPYDGLLYVYLTDLTFVSEMNYKDLRFEETFLINQSTKIIGHTHTDTQIATIKNNEDVEIFMDTSPKNSVVGTLFLNTMVGLLQKRTGQWKRGHIPLEKRNLGYITTFETLFWRRVSRSILEGSFIGLLHDNKHKHLSLLSVMRYTDPTFSDKSFVWGKFEIDYKHDQVINSPMWEQWQDGETDSDLAGSYEFKYLYAAK